MATIRRRNSKYHVQIRRVGQSSITRSFLLREDAKTWARQMELQADRRDLPANPKVLEQITLGQLIQRYIDSVSPRKKTNLTEQIVLKAFLRHRICAKSMAQLEPSDFVAYRDERLSQIKPSSLKRSLVPVRHMFEVARDEWGYPIKVNLVAKLKITDTDLRRERRLRPGEEERLLRAASTCRNKWMKPLILLGLATGMRRGEMLNLRIQHLDLQRRTLFISHSKNGYSRTIPLMKEAVLVLQGLTPAKDRLFPVSGNAVRLSWEHLRIRASLDDFHFHDLRHEAISRLFELGLSMPEVALISGHRDFRMLFRYSHAIRETILEKLDCGGVNGFGRTSPLSRSSSGLDQKQI